MTSIALDIFHSCLFHYTRYTCQIESHLPDYRRKPPLLPSPKGGPITQLDGKTARYLSSYRISLGPGNFQGYNVFNP